MLNTQKKVTIEMDNNSVELSGVTNPLSSSYSDTDKISLMVMQVLHEELPQLKNNSLLYDLVLYSITEKMKTVQTVGNVLSYIKEKNVKTVQDVSIENGEIRIKCLD